MLATSISSLLLEYDVSQLSVEFAEGRVYVAISHNFKSISTLIDTKLQEM